MDKEEENRLAMESLEDLNIPSYFFQSIEKITNQYFLNAICSISSLGVTHKSNIKVSSICEHFYHLISKLKKKFRTAFRSYCFPGYPKFKFLAINLVI